MDFKLDLKLQNEVDLSISKNEPAVVFTAHQTDSMFSLTFDLKKGGYGREDIKIEINEDGSRLTISGEKNSKIKRRGFHKTFIIPEGVVLDKVKARFDQHQSRLTIRMPKSVKGLLLLTPGIQEFKDHLPVPEEVKGSSSELKKKEVESESRVEDNEGPKERMYTAPILVAAAGSTLFASLIVVLFSLLRSKNQSTKKTA